MTRSFVFSLSIACALSTVTACSRTSSQAGMNASREPGVNSAAQATPSSVCDRKLVDAADVAGLLSQPVTITENIPGDPQSCKFQTAGFSSVTISVRPGHGLAAVGMYTSGKMDEYEKSVPLSGVGDAAVRSEGLNRIVARKGDLLCEITGPGLARGSDDPVTRKLGEICNKIFAAY